MSTPIQDPVVVYDLMWEATNRLTSIYVGQIEAGGTDDPAIRMIQGIRAEAEAVDTDDLERQRALTVDFRERRRVLLGDWD